MTSRGLLIDLDGVLVDSRAAVDRAWNWWATRHGLDPAPFVDAHGRTAREVILDLAPGLDPDLEAALVEGRELSDTQGILALPGARELLASSEPLAIVTSCPRPLALARLQEAKLTAPAVLVTAESVTRGKPDPEPYLLGARWLGLAPAQCVVFEDAPAGVSAGKAAGMRVVGLTTNVGAAELTQADVVVANLAACRR